MARSVILQLARDSIEEVLEAKRKIDKNALVDEYPLLAQSVDTSVKIFINNEPRGSSNIASEKHTLIENIVLNAKKAAFEDKEFTPLSTSEYLGCEIEVELKTPDGVMSERDPSILETTSYSIEKELED
jgi:AMMECR1 domain-containing protein